MKFHSWSDAYGWFEEHAAGPCCGYVLWLGEVLWDGVRLVVNDRPDFLSGQIEKWRAGVR